MTGKLVVGSMPIGNPDDITIRMLKAIHDCDIIYSDYLPDNINNLLKLYSIEKEVVVLNSTNTMHADMDQVNDVVLLISRGKTVLLVAGEGQVGVADPGTQFIQACIEKSLPYTVLPGPSAFMTAFVASGIVNGDFFISCNMSKPEDVLERFRTSGTPVVVLVWQDKLTPILEHVRDCFSINKIITLACDMTMDSEMFLTGTAKELLANPRFKLINQSTKIALVMHDN
jgi:16S rRNA (cytidine1402-2'-O)-methyltransferase